MKLAAINLGLILIPAILEAQDRPQFAWEGSVDGICVLYLRANRLDLRVSEGAPIDRQKFNFAAPLPEIRQDARLEVIAGRGYVHILEQPRLGNQYTLAVTIEDRQPGASFYSIALYWDASNLIFEGNRSNGRSETMTWSGRVDEEAIIACQAKTCESKAAHGSAVAREVFKFSRPLPSWDTEVTLEKAEGRGQIRLVEQPSERNHYSARVDIRDPMPGSSQYSFTLRWPRGSGIAPEPPQPHRGLVWIGAVDGRVRITVRGGGSYSEVVEGRTIEGERADFLRPLPSRSDLRPAVKLLRGRGRVEIIESPSEANGYRLVFEINDPEPGSDLYEVEVSW